VLYPIDRLAKSHNRKTFSSGVEALDDYLKLYALQNDKKRVALAYVALDNKRVAGYYTLSNASVTLSEMPEAMAKRLPAYPVPAVRIGRFAVDQSVQGRGLGEQMLVDSLSRIVGASDIFAAFAVIIDANEQSVGFYKKYGFIQSRHQPLTLFLPVKTITQVLR